MVPPRPLLVWLLALSALAGAPVHSAGQTGATNAAPIDMVDNVRLGDYLRDIGQLSPIVREGAELYMLFYQQRCGKQMTALSLRKAFVRGEPSLLEILSRLGAGDRLGANLAGAKVACNGG